MNYIIITQTNGDNSGDFGQCHIMIQLISFPAYLQSVSIHYQIRFGDKEIARLVVQFSDVNLGSEWHEAALSQADVADADDPVFETFAELYNVSHENQDEIDHREIRSVMHNKPSVAETKSLE